MVFHATPGKDDREAQSPSFFNVFEALQVKRYVELLRTDASFRIGLCASTDPIRRDLTLAQVTTTLVS